MKQKVITQGEQLTRLRRDISSKDNEIKQLILGLHTLLNFVVPPNYSVPYEALRSDLKSLQPENGSILTLCQLMHDFGIKECQFGLGLHSTDVAFNTCIDIMYIKLCQLSIWPHRDTIIRKCHPSTKMNFSHTLTGCDLNGGSMFVSEIFRGTVSDKAEQYVFMMYGNIKKSCEY
ncbi:LOW QUALITY PROTEIN: hypothetical protein MAR_036256 [Mya arenaria]|uniref:Uncharacterized protein n=1 Tax=Mya arenaria TaxID=6604 RepID=A0ABY7EMG3_MYAAR|nr:LOW QUALITY PROTEIN: hypothetical protein MAR_036256 [Mya arenaria]